MDDDDGEKKSIVEDWHVAFKRATDFDLWGQPVEAIDSYIRLAANMRYESHPDGIIYTDDQKKIINKLATVFEMRSQCLKSPGKLESMSLSDVKKVETCIQNLTTMLVKDFPLTINIRGRPFQERPSNVSLGMHAEDTVHRRAYGEENDEDCLDSRVLGRLLPQPEVGPDLTVVTIRIERMGLKDAGQYIDPFMTISVKDPSGVDLTPVQESPIITMKDDTCIFFAVDVHLQKPLEHLPENFAVFFEFKHYKPKKKIVSTKCWAFMERDEIKEGNAVLEIYKKPADYRRKKINLLTIKPLYLHLKVLLNA